MSLPGAGLIHGMQCGLSASEGQFKMQEDLATLFSRNLTFANPSQTSLDSLDNQALATTRQSHPITYITQHYNHSAHVAPATASSQHEPTSSSTTSIEEKSPAAILSENNVDALTLFPSQLTLFQQANADQRLRLIELWQISPPSYGGHALAHELGNWPPTSLEQEEEMARLRYERNISEEKKAQEGTNSNHTEPACNGTMIVWQEGDGRPNAEPYILSGYETLAQRDYDIQSQQQQQQDEMIDDHPPRQSAHDSHYDQATDPVYQGQEWWHNFVGKQAMENQYGAFDQMNRFGTPSSVSVGVHGAEDEEML